MPAWGLGPGLGPWRLAAGSELLEATCPAGYLLASLETWSNVSVTHAASSACSGGGICFLYSFLNPPRDRGHVFGSRKTGKASQGLAVGREGEDKRVSSQHGVKTCGYVVLGMVSSLY